MDFHSAAYHADGDWASTNGPINQFPDYTDDEKISFWYNLRLFRSRHPGGCHFGLGDGSVHFISDGIDLASYQALASKAGSEVVDLGL